MCMQCNRQTTDCMKQGESVESVQAKFWPQVTGHNELKYLRLQKSIAVRSPQLDVPLLPRAVSSRHETAIESLLGALSLVYEY